MKILKTLTLSNTIWHKHLGTFRKGQFQTLVTFSETMMQDLKIRLLKTLEDRAAS